MHASFDARKYTRLIGADGAEIPRLTLYFTDIGEVIVGDDSPTVVDTVEIATDQAQVRVDLIPLQWHETRGLQNNTDVNPRTGYTWTRNDANEHWDLQYLTFDTPSAGSTTWEFTEKSDVAVGLKVKVKVTRVSVV